MRLLKRKHHSSHFAKYAKIIFFRFDFISLGVMLLLLAVGVLFIYNTGQHDLSTLTTDFWFRQIKWISLGSLAWLFLAFMDYRYLKHFAIAIFVISIIALLAVFIQGQETNGAMRWIKLTDKIKIQPSEFAKFAVILLGSWILSLKNFDINKLSHLSLFLALFAIPFLLIYMQPDLGSSLVLVPISALLLFTARLKWIFIILAICLVGIATPVHYKFFMNDYQKNRIKVYWDPDLDVSGTGWHQKQSIIAVGSGGLYGKGLGNGEQDTLGFLSEAHTDFIFSVIGEETGFIGACSLITLYILLLLSALRTAIFARDPFGQYLAIGIASLFFFHSFVNIGMCVRVTPVTGLPLPLVSYGGSFIVISMVYLGILQSIYAHRKRLFEEKTSI